MKQSELLNMGTKVEYLNGQLIWTESTIKRISEYFVWFNGSGMQRIKKTTFDTSPMFFRIKQ